MESFTPTNQHHPNPRPHTNRYMTIHHWPNSVDHVDLLNELALELPSIMPVLPPDMARSLLELATDHGKSEA